MLAFLPLTDLNLKKYLNTYFYIFIISGCCCNASPKPSPQELLIKQVTEIKKLLEVVVERGAPVVTVTASAGFSISAPAAAPSIEPPSSPHLPFPQKPPPSTIQPPVSHWNHRLLATILTTGSLLLLLPGAAARPIGK
jgi:hypothetical protein